MKYQGLTLDRFQTEAIEALANGESVLVCAPTGTGKTLVADWMVEKALSEGREVIFTAPIKALSNQKFRDYCALFGEDKVGLVTGDLVIRRDAPCRVMTTEILRNILLLGEDLPHLAAVIIDEIHFLDDKERGTTWEELLIYLDPEVQVVGLSATLANQEDFANWLESVRGRPVRVIEEHTRAVPLTFRVASREGGLKSPEDMRGFHKGWQRKHAQALSRMHKGQRGGGRRGRNRGRHGSKGGGRRGGRDRVGSQTRHGDIFQLLWPDYAPYLYFVFSRRDAEAMARGLTQRLQRRESDEGQPGLLSVEEKEKVRLRIRQFRIDGGVSALDRDQAAMYQMGIAFHHAGLHVSLKALVEELYEARLIKVLYCTGTFALGINMPARTAVFDGLMRFDGQGMIQLPTREFMQMAGRAGRRGMDTEGMVVVRSSVDDFPEIDPQLKRYLQGKYEPVHSRFSLSFHSVINLLERHPQEKIRALVEKSFLAHVRRASLERHERNAELLAESLESRGWTEGESWPKAIKKDVKRLRRLQSRVAEGTEKTWAEFSEKVHFLQRWGYLNEEMEFMAGAQALRQVQIAEIFATELFMEGVLDELDMPTLFGVLCGMCAELPRGAFTAAARRHRALGRRIERIRFSEVVVESEQLSRARMSWDHQMIPIGHWWATGRSLEDILMEITYQTDISGGLVGAFRRAKELAGQLRGVWSHDSNRVKEVEALIRKVTRDEVEVVD